MKVSGFWSDVVQHSNRFELITQLFTPTYTIGAYDETGKLVWTHPTPQGMWFMRATALRDGTIAIIGQPHNTPDGMQCLIHYPDGTFKFVVIKDAFLWAQNGAIIEAFTDETWHIAVQIQPRLWRELMLKRDGTYELGPVKELPVWPGGDGSSSQGFLQWLDHQVVWSDPNRFRVVHGETVLLAVTDKDCWAGQKNTVEGMAVYCPNGVWGIVHPEAAAFEPRILVDDSGRVAVASRSLHGLAIFSVILPPYDLPPIPPPAPPPDPPTPEPPPNRPSFTITSYAPQTGTRPLKVLAIYAPLPDAGPITTITWRYRVEGASSWTDAVTNPGNDTDHTYTFDAVGRYEISAETRGPGGTWETGSKRLVIVSPIEPEPPTPPVYLEGSRGVQTGFEAPLGDQTYKDLKVKGWNLARISSVADATLNEEMVNECRRNGIRPLVLCYPEHIGAVPEWVDIEVYNEPDIGVSAWPKLTPQEYAARVLAILPLAEARHQRVWVGVVSNSSIAPLNYLRAVLALLPQSVNVTLHRYPQSKGDGPNVPRSDYPTRAAEMDAIKAVVGPRAWGVSEFAYTLQSYTQPLKWWQEILKLFGWKPPQYALSETDQATYAKQEFELWKAAGASFACWWQVWEASPDTGLMRQDRSWRPVSDIFTK